MLFNSPLIFKKSIWCGIITTMLALAVAAPVFADAPTPAPSPTTPGDTALERLQRISTPAGIRKDRDVRDLVARVINVAFGLLGVAVFGFYVYAGFLWMTAQGESEKVEKAQDILKETTIGLVILLAAYGISRYVVLQLVRAVGS